MTIAIWVICGVVSTLAGTVYLMMHAPSEIPLSFEGKVVQVLWYKDTIARLLLVDDCTADKKQKKEKYIIPPSCKTIEVGKCYRFFKNAEGVFCAKEVTLNTR